MMKTKLLSFFFIAFCQFVGKAQTAEILFVNNNSGTGAASLDVEVRVMPQDTVYALYTGVNYLGSSTIITVPANVILKINYLEAGSSTIFYSNTNIVYSPNQFTIHFMYGTGSSKYYTSFSGAKQSSSSGKIKFDFKHSTSSLQDIDLIIRETSKVLADNFTYTDLTSGFDDEFNAANYILDMTPNNDNSTGIFAYQLPGTTIGGEYIFLFTAGTGSANNMYMVRMNGTVTKLTAVTPYTGINELSPKLNIIKTYPNPASDVITVGGEEENLDISTITIYNINGQKIFSSPSNRIDVSSLENGVYSLQVEVGQTSYYSRIVVSR